jgi:hypothetical protein
LLVRGAGEATPYAPASSRAAKERLFYKFYLISQWKPELCQRGCQ